MFSPRGRVFAFLGGSWLEIFIFFFQLESDAELDGDSLYCNAEFQYSVRYQRKSSATFPPHIVEPPCVISESRQVENIIPFLTSFWSFTFQLRELGIKDL